jgi:hypothetical protein
MADSIEFFYDGRVIAYVDSSHAPDRGDMVNIKSTTYHVIGRTYTVDYAGERHAKVVCIITLALDELKKADGK